MNDSAPSTGNDATTGATFVTRLATRDDVEAMADVCARAARQAYAHLAPPGFLDRLIARRFSPACIATELSPSGPWLGYVVACDRNGRVAGVAGTGLTRVDDEYAAELHVLYVAPEHQGRGAGRRLVADALQRARMEGVTRLDVAVWPGNDHAVGFYLACGFTPMGERTIEPVPGLEDGPSVAVMLALRRSAPGGPFRLY